MTIFFADFKRAGQKVEGFYILYRYGDCTMYFLSRSFAVHERNEGHCEKQRDNVRQKDIITINVPLFKKLRDIIFFLQDNNFLNRFEGYFEGAKTFLTP